MAKLTAGEQHILRYPPTPETWECGKQRQSVQFSDGHPITVTVTCRGITTSGTICSYCGEPKRRGALRLRPLYEAACKKAGIEPGTRWPVKAEPIEDAKPSRTRTRRKGA